MQVKSNAPSLGQTPMLRAVLIKRLPGIQAPGGRPIQSVLGSSWEHPRQFSVLIRCICQRLKQASLLMASYTTHALLPRKPRATGKCLTLRDGLHLQWVTSRKHQADLGHFSWTQHDFGTRARSTERLPGGARTGESGAGFLSPWGAVFIARRRSPRCPGFSRRSRLLYFACISLKYRARLSIRTRPRSWSRSTSEKTGPHAGIAPCPRRSSSPEMIRSIRINGNVPPLRSEMRVKSAGGSLSVEAAGPLPLASGP